jgi:hypothetical protein
VALLQRGVNVLPALAWGAYHVASPSIWPRTGSLVVFVSPSQNLIDCQRWKVHVMPFAAPLD